MKKTSTIRLVYLHQTVYQDLITLKFTFLQRFIFTSPEYSFEFHIGERWKFEKIMIFFWGLGSGMVLGQGLKGIKEDIEYSFNLE